MFRRPTAGRSAGDNHAMGQELFPTDHAYTGLAEDRLLRSAECRYVIGLDEAGRGCLAGPVVAAAVALPVALPLPGVTDSKKLSPKRRELLAAGLKEQRMIWATAEASAAEIDQSNILACSLACMERAAEAVLDRLLAEVAVLPDDVLVLVDGNQALRGWRRCRQKTIVSGDLLSRAVAAASIIAKTSRDGIMDALASQYPAYCWAKNKGYGTADHLEALRLHGPTPYHRMSFTPLNAR